ncbi:uncharacterized protein LOC111042458 [Myzus persicae]|uniref:uncharacterized protein LOC111042458 n=1 Tax=Myzus persicae TaxID=13164 RepID=UPI000B939582|nr:uncharacterized protein LOC111042458 [Myzus persicae]
MEYAANLLILFAIISSVEVVPYDRFIQHNKSEDYNIRNNVRDSVSGSICPPFGKNAKFEVETIQTKSPMYGCAYMGNTTQMTTAESFHLWLERPVETMAHGHCNNMQNMDHFIFECVSKNIPINKYEVELGWQYISLLEHTADENMQNKTKKRFHRCALYDMRDQDDRMVRIIRMVISKPIAGDYFNVRQCKGLSELLDRDELPIIPEGSRYWPDGSMYLYLLGRKANSFMTTNKNSVTSLTTTTISSPSTTTITSRPSTTTTTSRPSTTTMTTLPTTTSTTTAHYSIDDFFRDFIIDNNS